MNGWKSWHAWLIPRSEREVVLRELDDLHARLVTRRGSWRAGYWYAWQILVFSVRLRLEALSGLRRGFDGLVWDARYSARSLLRRPGYLAAAVLTLGIGTGGVAVVYSAANWVLLRGVPGVHSTDGLTQLRVESRDDAWGGLTWGIPDADIERLRERIPSLRVLEASADYPVHVRAPGAESSDRVIGSLVTPGYFAALEMTPSLGRFFEPASHGRLAGPPEVVIGHDLWRRYALGSTGALGAELDLNGVPFTVIGVAPEGFRGAETPGASQIWVASSSAETIRGEEGDAALDGQLWNHLVGRRQPGVTPESLAVEANEAIEDIRRVFAGQSHGFYPDHFVLRAYDGLGLDPFVRTAVQRTLVILAGACGFLLLLAIANVANLALTRAASRRHLSAIRRAFGAGAWRVGREPLIEGALVGLAGGAVGLAVALSGRWAFAEARLAAQGASLEGMTVGVPIVLVTLAVSVAAGLLAGLAPAFVVRHEVKLPGRASAGDARRGTHRLRSTLVVLQVALSGTLLVGAGLFGHTVINLNGIDLGLSKDAFMFSVDPGPSGYDESRALQVLAEIERGMMDEMGTRAVGGVFPAPMTGWRITASAKLPSGDATSESYGSQYWTTGSGFFEAIGIPFVAGRGFRQDLRAPTATERPVVLNETMAQALYPGLGPESVVGSAVMVGRDSVASTVVGVVRDARLSGPLSASGAMLFMPYDMSWAEGSATFFVGEALSLGEMNSHVSSVLRRVDAGLPSYDAGTLSSRVSALLAEQRIVARLAGALGAIGLLLMALGLYGVLSYAVHERTREIGVRVALGASTGRVREGIVRQGLAMTAVGLGLGLPLAWLSSRLIESRLYDVAALDVASYAAGALVLVLVAGAASWIPARRATRISPMEALREA